MSTLKRLTAFALTAVMLVSLFAGCGKKPEDTLGETDEIALNVSAVAFSREGRYTATVSSEEVDLSGVTAENTVITYYDADMSRDFEENAEAASDSDAFTPVKIENVRVSGNTAEITFTDDTAAEQLKDQYFVEFKDIGAQDVIPVDYPEMTLVYSGSPVKAADKDIKLELTLDGGEFTGSIGKDDIELANAFAEMKIKSVSAVGNRISLELSGSPVRTREINAMEWGTVIVKAGGIKEGYSDIRAAIDVERQYSGIDAETLSFDGGSITADIYFYGGADITALTEKDITIDGVTTKSVKKKDEHTVSAVFSADGLESVNDFAALVNGKEMKLGDGTVSVYIPTAGFYPRFDSCEEDGDSLKLTLELLASGGSFAKTLSKDQVTLSGDFENAKIVSLTRGDEQSADLVLTVPSNGTTAENCNYHAAVTLAEGALVNEWGEGSGAEISYTRSYSGDNLGRGPYTIPNNVTLNKETLLEIQKYTRGQDTAFGQILYWGNNIYQVYSFGKAVLECLGVIESDYQKEMNLLNEMNQKLDGIYDLLKDQSHDFERTKKELYVQNLQPYFDHMSYMMDAYEGMRALYMNAATDAAERGVTIDVASATDAEITEYNDYLTDLIAVGSKDPTNTRYKSYNTNYEKLYNEFKAVTNAFIRTDPNPLPDPLDTYDEFCAMEYNFDTQSYYPRVIFREYAIGNLEKVMSILHMQYKTSSDPKNYDFLLLDQRFRSAVAKIDEKAPAGHAPDEIRANLRYQTTYTKQWVSDIKVVGYDGSAQKCKDLLTSEGYTVVDRDINDDAGGYYIYLGYKMTDDYNNAIKDIIVRKGKGNNSDTYKYNDLNYYLCPYDGDREFINSKGDLNEEAGGSYLYFYYTKEATPVDPAYGRQSTAVGKLSISNYARGTDLNDDAGGFYIYLHADKCDEEGWPSRNTNVWIDNDPEYYPYCYPMGCKICVRNSVEYKDYCSTWLDGVGYVHQWDKDQLNVFLEKMKAPSVSEEFASAGIELEYPLAIKMTREHKSEKSGGTLLRSRYDTEADVFLLGSAELTKDLELSKIYTRQHPKSSKKDDSRYHEVSMIQLR